MSQLMLLGDLHISDTSPSSYIGSYLDDLFETLEHTVELAREYKVSAIVQAGDYLDNKNPIRTSHSTIIRTIDLLNSYPSSVFAVPGNHDLRNGRLDTIYQTQPLGVLYKSGALIDLRGWADDYPIYGIPWQQRWTDEAIQAALEAWHEPTADAIRNPAKSLVVTHAPLFPPGAEPRNLPNFEYYPTAKFADAMGNKGHVYYGHIHEPHGTYEVNGVTFCNNGALSRGSIAEYNLTRELYATLWDTKTGKFERITLPSKPASEIFRLPKETIEDEGDRFDDFLNSVDASSIEVTSIELVIAKLKSMNIKPKLLATLEELLEEAKSNTQ